MSSSSSHRRLYLQEFRRTFETTGSFAPSSPSLCRELARFVPAAGANPRRILEVGPATGVVTDQILAALGPHDTLDLCELNERFVDVLQGRLTEEPAWREVAPRVTIHPISVEDLASPAPYDAVVSGLPLANFSVDLVRRLTSRLAELVAPGGTLSYFGYVGVRRLKSIFAGREERRRLAGIDAILADIHRRRQFLRTLVPRNLPPAWVFHLRY